MNEKLHASGSVFPDIPDNFVSPAISYALLQWFAQAKRSLPWRTTYEPYAVWISEIMLQQTQMERGVAYFSSWMRQFPTIFHVAQADLETILRAWEGLGYYSRAKNLHAAAQMIVAEFSGVFPQSVDALLRLPGVGRYTAGAIVSIAYNLPEPIVDANVARVFSRIFNIYEPIQSKKAQNFLWRAAAATIPNGQARNYNQALMELGALVCSKNPACGNCPVSRGCQAHQLSLVSDRPVMRTKVDYIPVVTSVGLLISNGRIFIQKRLEEGIWAGLWEFPGGRIEAGETPEQALVREYLEETQFNVMPLEFLGEIRHSYTRYRLKMHCFICRFVYFESDEFPVPQLQAAQEYRWVSPEELDSYVFPAPHRKMLQRWMPQILAQLHA